jgi:hypothetical protein
MNDTPTPSPSPRHSASASLLSNRVFYAIAFVVLALLWAVGNYPALLQAWWFRDDFILGYFFHKYSFANAAYRLFACEVNEGRPFGALAEAPFCLNYYPHAAVNVALHWAQGLAHVGLAIFIAQTLSRYLPRWQTIVAVVPFVFWAFNGEAVLWSSNLIYLLGSFASLAGLRLIVAGIANRNPSWCRMGAIFSATALLVVQSVGTFGFMVWSILLALRLIEAGRLEKTWLKEGTWLLGGYVLGGVLTSAIAILSGCSRAGISLDLSDKITYWVQLNYIFLFWPGYYPLALDLLHGALLFLGLALPVYFLSKAGQGRALISVLAILAAGFVLPYVAYLIVATDPLSFRTFYFAPLTFTLLAAVIFRATYSAPWAAGVGTAVIGLMALFDMGISQVNARDYVRLYDKEREVLAKLEQVSAATHCDLVIFLSDQTALDPFGMDYTWYEGHLCDFERFDDLKASVEDFTSLRVVHPSPREFVDLLQKKVDAFTRVPGVAIYYLEDFHVIYLRVSDATGPGIKN